MITSLITQKIIHNAFFDHPVVFPKSCINHKPSNACCSVCADICRQNVFSSDHPKYEKCLNCNLCSAACPTQVIRPPSMFSGKVDNCLQSEKKRLYIHCHQTENNDSDLILHCIASLPWEVYATFSLTKKVIFYLSRCEGCEYAEYAKALISDVQSHLSKDFYNVHFPLFPDGFPKNGMTRRELFRFAGHSGRNAAKHLAFGNNAFSWQGVDIQKIFACAIEQKRIWVRYRELETTAHRGRLLGMRVMCFCLPEQRPAYGKSE
jgi:ferredoxin